MTYFKVIQNNEVVSVGNVFLQWDERKNKLYICDVDHGQFVLSYDEQHIYHDDWLKKAPDEAGQHEEADISIITLAEYEELLELLSDGEEVLVAELPVIQEPEPIAVQKPEEEKPMTIAEMRKIILRQQEQINILLEKVN